MAQSKLVLEGYIEDYDGRELRIVDDTWTIEERLYRYCFSDKNDYCETSTKRYRITFEELED